MDALCPQCQHTMIWQHADRFHCAQCGNDFRQEVHCPDCGELLQVMSACGSVSYFCPHGHGLISRAKAVFRYPPVME